MWCEERREIGAHVNRAPTKAFVDRRGAKKRTDRDNVYARLEELARDQHPVLASNEEIAIGTGIMPSTIKDHLKELKDLDLIRTDLKRCHERQVNIRRIFLSCMP